MANYAYLCCSPYRGLVPSLRYSAFDPERHIVAAAVCTIPLLWLAMFRHADIKQARYEKSSVMGAWKAPLAPLDRVLGQLDAAVPILQPLFPEYEYIADYAPMLRQTLLDSQGTLVTIDYEEVAIPYRQRPAAARARLLVYPLCAESPGPVCGGADDP
jgi:hypothetical protein